MGLGEKGLSVSVIQLGPEFGCKQKNLEKSSHLIRSAAAEGAKLMVLPELCSTGYVFQNKTELYDLAEPVPNGPSVLFWENLSSELDCYIIAGIAELDADGIRVFNSVVLIGPNGYIGRYRKLHLWGEEKLYFEPGNEGLPVFYTPYCRIGMLICYDMWFPEAFRLLALQGVDVICCSSNWIDHSPAEPSTMGVVHAMAGASSNKVFVAVSNRVGAERGALFAGNSLVTGTNGRMLAGPMNNSVEGFITQELDIKQSREIKPGM